MADDFEDFDFGDSTLLQNEALSLSKLLAMEDEGEDGGFEKLLGKLNDKDLEDIIDLDTLEQLEKDFLADEQTSSGDSPDRILSPPYKAHKRKISPERSAGKHSGKGKGKRVPDHEARKPAEKVYCFCRQPQNNRFMICCDRCEEWYHGDCVGISVERGREMEKASEDYTCEKCKPAAHIPSTFREKAKSLKVATVVPTKHYSADIKYNRFDSYDHIERSTSKCKNDGCTEYALRNSTFCSDKCVYKFAQDTMKGKSSTQVSKSEITDHEEIPRYEEKKMSQPNPLRLGVRKHLKTLLTTRAKEATDLLVTEDEIVKIAQNIEMSLYKLYPDCGNRYKSKCKAICYNISDSKNVNLYRNILSGTLSSEKLAKMSPEEMSVRVKAKQLHVAAAASSAADSGVNIMDMLGDTTAQHGTHVFDVKCRKCTGKAPKQKEPKPAPKQPEPDPYAEPIVNRLAISAKPLKDPLGLNPALWKGYITMTSLTKFATSGYHVFGPHESLLSVLPDTLHVQGRIENNIVWAYVDRLKNSPAKDLIILKFESLNGEEVQGYSNLFHYLHTRKRCGVIGNVTAPVRDMYLVPLSAEGAMPPQLRLLGVSSIPKKNRTNLILGLIVIQKIGQKRPREPQYEAVPPDDKDEGSRDGSRDLQLPGSLEHLSSFPTDVSMPFNLAGASGDLLEAAEDEDDEDDDGINDIDLILRNNLDLPSFRDHDEAAHCKEEEEEDQQTPNFEVKRERHDPSFTDPGFPMSVDGRPILSPLTPLAPPALSFHPDDTMLTNPQVFQTDYSPVSPSTKHTFLTQQQQSNIPYNPPNPGPNVYNPPPHSVYPGSPAVRVPPRDTVLQTSPSIPHNYQTIGSPGIPSNQNNNLPNNLVNNSVNSPLNSFVNSPSVYKAIPANVQTFVQRNAVNSGQNMVNSGHGQNMINSGQNMVTSGQSIMNPGSNMVNSGPSMVNSSQNMLNSVSNMVNVGLNMANPGQRMVNPGQRMVNPGQRMVNPGQRMVNPGQRMVNPGQRMVNPGQRMVNPGQRMVEPGHNMVNNTGQRMLNPRMINPNQDILKDTQNLLNSNQNYVNSDQHHLNPAQQHSLRNPVSLHHPIIPNNMMNNQNLLPHNQLNQMPRLSPNPNPQGMIAQQTVMIKSQSSLNMPNKLNHHLSNNSQQIKDIPQPIAQNMSQTMTHPIPMSQNLSQQPRNMTLSEAQQLLSQPPRMMLKQQLNTPSAQQQQLSRDLMLSHPKPPQLQFSSRGQMIRPHMNGPGPMRPGMMVRSGGVVSRPPPPPPLSGPRPAPQRTLIPGPLPDTPPVLPTLRPNNVPRSHRITAPRMSVLRQTVSPVKGPANLYLAPQQQPFMIANNRQPVAMGTQRSPLRAPVLFQTNNINNILPQQSPTKPKNTNKRSNIKAKLKSKIDRNKGLAPKVKKAPKMFDGDSLLAQLEDFT